MMKKTIKFISTETYFNVVKKIFNRELHRDAPADARLILHGVNPDLCRQPGQGVPNVLLTEHIGKEITRETECVMLLMRPVYWHRDSDVKQYLFEAFPAPAEKCNKIQNFIAISGRAKQCTLSSRSYKIFVDADWAYTKTFQTGGTGHKWPLHIIIAESGTITITGQNHTGCGNDFEDKNQILIDKSDIYISDRTGIHSINNEETE